MAPPIPLPQVASTLALSFTTGRAAPAPEPSVEQPPAVEQADGAPKPPTLPALPGSDPTPEPQPDPEPDPAVEPGGEGEVMPPDPSSTTVGAPPPPVGEIDPVTPPSSSAVTPFEYERPLSPAQKPRASLLKETEKRLFFHLFVGGAKNFRGYYNYFPGMDFKSEIALGGGDPTMRIQGAAVIQVSSGFPLNTFTIAPRVQFNRQIVPGYAFYFTTNLTLGYRATTPAGYGLFQGLADVYQHSAVGAVGWGVSAIVAERLLLSFRPLNLEIAGPASNIADFNWDVLGGLGIVW